MARADSKSRGLRAGDVIPFGYAVKVDGQGIVTLANLAEMDGVAKRPRWANAMRGQRETGQNAYEHGDAVEIATDRGVLMHFTEKATIREGIVILPGSSEYVQLRGGKLVG